MATLSLTQAATAAAQFLMVEDSGESLSTQQLADALAAANALLDNWTIEQVRTINLIVQAFNLAAGTYTPGSTIQFPDTVSSITLPAGYVRPLELALAIELAPQYDMQPSAALLKNYAEARTAASILTVSITAGAPQANRQGGA